MSFARAAGRPSSGCTRWRQDLSDACAMLSLLDHACGSFCGSITAPRAAAMISGAWPPPAGRANRCLYLTDECHPGWTLRPGRSFHGQPGWQVAHRVGSPDQAMISLFGAVALTSASPRLGNPPSCLQCSMGTSAPREWRAACTDTLAGPGLSAPGVRFQRSARSLIHDGSLFD
jgi:hypothetical protein